MLFRGSISSSTASEHPASSSTPAYLERDLPPTPTPTSPVPSFNDFQQSYVPTWMRDNASTTSTTRQSRASSIVSNLTRFTTTSLDDARSIDIQVGGQNFRIARDASKITSEAPPPYTADEATDGPQVLDDTRPRTRSIRTPPSDNNSDGPSRQPTRTRMMTTLGANILDPTEVDIPSPVGDDDSTPPSTPSTSARSSERTVFSSNDPVGNSSSGYGDHIDSQGALTRSLTVRPYKYSGPQRRVDLPLLSTTSNGLEMQRMRPRSSQFKAWQTMSAEDLLLSHPDQESQEPRSPNYIGRDADGVFPSRTARRVRQRSDSGYNEEEDAPKEEDSTEMLDTERNEISVHYARMIRFVDKQHRRALHARDKEMEQLRERLAEIDVVYRQQLKARDFIIEDLKRRLDHMEDSMEVKLEQARNEVEDLWERRWKDRDFHLQERMSRIEVQASLDLQMSRETLAGHDEGGQ